jgi:hypothetical protein
LKTKEYIGLCTSWFPTAQSLVKCRWKPEDKTTTLGLLTWVCYVLVSAKFQHLAKTISLTVLEQYSMYALPSHVGPTVVVVSSAFHLIITSITYVVGGSEGIQSHQGTQSQHTPNTNWNESKSEKPYVARLNISWTQVLHFTPCIASLNIWHLQNLTKYFETSLKKDYSFRQSSNIFPSTAYFLKKCRQISSAQVCGGMLLQDCLDS